MSAHVNTIKKLGNYHLTGNKLGEGNFARVEEAVHDILQTKVALKIIDTNVIKDEYALKNLEREAKMLSGVSHPCIVYLYETLRYRSLCCLVTELVPGNDLASFIHQQVGGRLDERTTRRFVKQIVSALSHMHTRGIVHRDLKLQNIVIDSQQSLVKIVDFGLSNIWSPKNPLRTNCGSPEYAAPELFIMGRTYGPEVDLWSLGVVLFGMATGFLPFQLNENEKASMPSGQQRRLLVSKIHKGIIQKHKNCISHFSKDFGDLVTGLLNPDPAQRLTLNDILLHRWTAKGKSSILLKIPDVVKSEEDFHQDILIKLAELTDTTTTIVQKRIFREPFASIGGMYNILHHEALKREWFKIETFSPLHMLSGSLSSGCLITRFQQKLKRTPNLPKIRSADIRRRGKSQFMSLEDIPKHLNDAKDKSNEIKDNEFQKCRRPWTVKSKSPDGFIGKSLQICRTKIDYSFYNYKKSQLEDYNMEKTVVEKAAREKIQYLKSPTTVKSTSTSYTSISRFSTDFKKSLSSVKGDNPIKSTRSVRLKNFTSKKNVLPNKLHTGEKKS